ncbi:pentapeptide repeat-containing protein, partial [Clostridioides difficile]
RVEFKNSKLIGVRFDDCILKNVLFKDVLGKYSNFSFSKFKIVSILDSNFENSVFQEVKGDNLVFEYTNLKKANFNGTKLSGIDFTTNNIEGIEIGIDDIRGAIFDVSQAIDLTKLMGIIIK